MSVILSVLLSGFVGLEGLDSLFIIGKGLVAGLVTFPVIVAIRTRGSRSGVIVLAIATLVALVAGGLLLASGVENIRSLSGDYSYGHDQSADHGAGLALFIALLVLLGGIYGLYRIVKWMCETE